MPTVVIVGEEDAITPPKEADALAAGIRGATKHVVPGAGHMAPLEQPDVVARHLAAWLEA